MKLATLRRPDGSTVAVRIDGGDAIEIPGVSDLSELLSEQSWRATASAADGARHPLGDGDDVDWAPVVPRPGKVICVGLNYRNHIREMGRELPEYPTLFAKYPEALIGATDDIRVPSYAAGAVDWEGELAIVIGSTARRVAVAEAASRIAGYAVLNDVTMRDYQYRTPEWFQGKTFEGSTPFGPVLVTDDEYSLETELRTEVDGEVVQRTTTDDLVFDPAALVSYISHIVTLHPGDVIASGTPGGVGHARTPARYLADGSELTTVIEGIGTLRNRVVFEQ